MSSTQKCIEELLRDIDMTFKIKFHNFFSNNTIIGALILSLFCILSQYSLPLLSYGIILSLIYGVISFFKYRRLSINKYLLIFILVSIIHQAIIYIATNTFEKNINTFFFMFISIFLLSTLSNISKQTFIKTYVIIGIICGVVVIYQFVLANIFGISQSSIRLLPINFSDLHYWTQNSNRVAGFFTEPQGYCSYILPLMTILLFKKRFLLALFFSVTILASTSSQGIILMMMVWIYYLFKYERKLFKKVIFILLFIVVLLILYMSGLFDFAFEKINKIDIFGYDVRLTKGFQIYYNMPFLDKMLGIGFGNLREYLLSSNFNFFWMSLTRNEIFDYVTTMSNLLISYGVIGFVFYINIFFKNIKNVSEISKIFLVIIFICSFTQTILFNSWFLFYWIIFQIFDNQRSDNYFIINLKRG